MTRLEISKKLVIVNSASSAAATVLNLSALVWLQQYLLRRISAEEYSLVPLVMAIMAFAPLISTVLTGGLGRYLTVAHARGDDEEVTSICSTMLPVLAAGAIIFLALGLLFAWKIDHLIRVPPKQLWDAQVMLGLLVFSGALQLPAAAFGAGFMVRQKLLIQDLISVGCQFLRLALLFGLLFGVSTRVLWVIVAAVASDLVNLAISLPISIRLLPTQRFRWSAIRWSLAREITSYGGWSLVDQVAQTARMAMDPIILNRVAAASEVATFTVAGIAPRQLSMLTFPLVRPFIPVFAQLYAAGDAVRLRNTYLRTARYNAWVIVTVAVPAIVFAKELMSLYLGGRYPGAPAIMIVLLCVPILKALDAMGPGAVLAAGKVRAYATRQLAVHAVNLSLTIVFVVLLGQGALGSASGTLLATLVVETTLMWPLSWRATHTTLPVWLREVFVPTVILALPSVSLCFILKWTVGITGWLSLFGASAASAAIYLVLVAAVGLRHQDRMDIDRLADRFPGPVKAVIRRLNRGLVAGEAVK